MKAGWTVLQFGEVFDDVSGGNRKIPQSAYLPKGFLPVVDQGKSLVAGYVNELDATCKATPPVIVFGDHTRCFKYIDFPFAMGADGVKVLRPKLKLDVKYLFYYLYQLKLPDAGYDRHYKYLKRSRIAFPPLAEQRRIAEILDRADALREKRRKSIAMLDTLVHSVFVEMFGDPVTNPKGWPVYNLSEVCEGKYGIKAGPFGSALKKETYTSSGYRVYGQEQVIAGDFSVGDYYIGQEKFEDMKAYVVHPNDVLISLVGTIGKVVVVPAGIEPGIINPRLLKISPKRTTLNPYFLATLLIMPSVQHSLNSVAHGGTMNILNAGLLKNLKVILPSYQLQEQFNSWLNRITYLSKKFQKSSEGIDDLFQTLQQRAFNGQLTSDKIETTS